MAIPSFVDQVRLRVTAGAGGGGCTSVHREKFKPLGGPDGGNGGHGGSVILRVDPQVTTLVEYHRHSHRQADNGQPGRGGHHHGSHGEDIILRVPMGTVVRQADSGEVIADMVGSVSEVVIAQGGHGGLGNAALATKARKAPGFALLGEDGDDREIILELKVVADVGLVGFPSAGKSSLIGAISRATPEVADYPFTTLVPHLGVVVAGPTTFTVADVPGLIPGAAQGKGLGLDFLRHIERCQVLVHVIDCATYEPGRDPVSDLDAIEVELAAYGGLEDRPRMIVLNKVDIPDGAEMASMVVDQLTERGLAVFEVSAKTGQGLTQWIHAMAKIVSEIRERTPEIVAVPVVLKPTKDTGPQFTIARQSDDAGGFVWRVRGVKPERWVRQTDFNNAEAVGYLADRFNKLGIEDELLELGAEPGDAVAIGSGDNPVVFDFAPQIDIGAELLSARGEDNRLDEVRPAAARRRVKDAAYHAEKEAAQAVSLALTGLDEQEE